MTQKDFDKLFDRVTGTCREILCSKNKEYARGGDKLSNFKKAAGAQGCTPEMALRGMWMKHIISVSDYIDDLEKGIEHSEAAWDEKVIDSLNYLFLLKALLKEREDSK